MSNLEPSELSKNLDELATAWFTAKSAEIRAASDRAEIEAKIAAIVATKSEGSETKKTAAWKITTTGKMTRTIDLEAFDIISSQILPEFHPIKSKRELDEKGFKWLQENRPDVFVIIAPLVTTKPAKTAVKCEPLTLNQGE